ncbi:uncharacterized protein BDV17DRAFT_301425 [Aspergillus undulatus]|uniref:uncharacterized protein n=1 Tax=Aspergillus undulatus TaxID=1810928 RepID=UPI003CCE4346
MASSSIYTQGSNFGNLLQKGVDPRTGQYTCAIDVWEAASEARNCPPLKLTLSFNPLSPANLGLGEGWSFNFTYYDQDRHILNLSTSESFQVTKSESSVTVQDQKLRNFKFQKKGSVFVVAYKSGQVEVLGNDCGVFDKYVPCEIYAANGRRLDLVWTSYGGHPQLVKIQESAEDLLKIDYSASPPKIIRYPGSPEESVFRLRLNSNQLTELVLPLPNEPSWTFTYRKYDQCVCITEVTSPTGLVEAMAYNPSGHKLPPKGPMESVPYVAQHTVKPGNGQCNIITTYAFSDNNYLGYGSKFNWSDDQDNLYRTSEDYEYWSTMTVDEGAVTRNIYNHFHLLISSERREPGKGPHKVTQRIKYYAQIPGSFHDQVPQFQLPRTTETTYEDTSNKCARVETTTQEYDEWGNPTRVIQADGVEIRRTYYDPQGEKASDSDSGDVGCPPDPYGFKRYMKTKTVIPAPSNYPALERTEKYRYRQIDTVNEAPADWFVTAQQQLSSDGIWTLSRTAFTYVERPTTRDHGRLKSQVVSHLDQYATTKTWDFVYPKGTQEVAITTRTTTFDALTIDEQTLYSTNTGLTRARKDSNGVEDYFAYDLLGRIVNVITSPGTEFEAVQTYDYLALGEGKGVQTEVTDIKGVKTRFISDGLGRLCRVEKQDPEVGEFQVLSQRKYNGQGQCIKATETDWLTGKDGKLNSHEITQALEYDDWGQVCKTTESTGRVTLSRSDPIERSTTAGIEGEGTTTGAAHERKYRYDGLYRLVEEEDQLGRVMKHISDSFDRVTRTTWSSGKTATTKYDEQGQAALPATVSVNDYIIGEQQFDGLGRVKSRKVGPRTTIQTYQGSSPEPAEISYAHGNVCAMEYEPAIQYTPKSIDWGGGSIDTFAYDSKSGLPTELKGSYSTLTRKYSSLGTLWAETIDIHEREAFSTEYQFSIGGRLQQYTNPHEQTQSVDYDEFGRPGIFTQGNIKVTLQYDQASRLEEHQVEDQETGTALSAVLTYDDFGRETSRSMRKGEETLSIQVQGYNEMGLVKYRNLMNVQGLPIRVEEFIYDDQNRLSEYQCSGERAPLSEQGRALQSQLFSFDNFHNITKRTTVFQDKSSNDTTYTYDKQDPCRLLQIANTHDDYPKKITLDYDADGRLTKDEQGRQLEYDTLGRLIRVRDDNKKLLCEYRYDATGKLASQIVPGKPETYLFYREESIIATKSGDCRTSYLSDGKTYWGQITQEDDTQSPQAQLWAGDGHDTVLAWVDSQAPDNIQYQSYTPYGLGAESGPDIAFNGQWRDPVTGWYHLGNGYRVYNPTLQRYHSPDPWSPFTSGEANPYLYCLSDPINRLDPSGHFSLFGIDINWKTFFGAVIGIAASIIVGVLTAGASLAVEIAVGSVVGGVTSAVSGVIGDLADGKTPTWKSVGIDFAVGLGGGILGPVAGRAWNAASAAIGDVLPSFGAAAGKTAASSVSKSIWRSGLKESLEVIGAEALFERATVAAVESFFYKTLPLKALWGMGSDLVTGSSDDSPSSRSQSSQLHSTSGSAQADPSERPQVGTPYVSRGSNLPRDTIRPLQKDGSSGKSSFTTGQSVADILTLSSRCSYALSRAEGGRRSETASFDDLRARIRAPPHWDS